MNNEDHDLLTKVSVCVESINKKVDKLENKLDKHVEDFVPKKLWMWVTGFIVILIFGSFTYANLVSTEVHTHATNMEIHDKVED